MALSTQSFSDRVLGQIHRRYATMFAHQPGEDRPTLVGAPDNLDINTATGLLTQASRWLEYVETEVAQASAAALMCKTALSQANRRAKYMHKAVDKWPLAVLENIERLESNLTQADAKLIVLKGIEGSLTQVYKAASRTVTRHTKVNGTDARFAP